MTLTSFSTIFHIIIAAIFLIIAVFVVRKRGFGDVVTRLLVIYSGVSILWEGVLASSTYLYYRLALPESVILHLPYYGLFLLAYLFLALSIAFLQDKAPQWGLWLFAPIWLGIVLILDFNWFGLPEILWQNPSFLIVSSSCSSRFRVEEASTPYFLSAPARASLVR